MENIYGESGANFSIARTHIGATDFAVDGKYSYAPVKDDVELSSFSIAVDQDGFKQQEYAGIKDEKFDYLINLQTSGRFSVKEVLNSLKKINLIKFDYVVFSRFLKKNSSKNYNLIRRFGNIFFSFFTRLFTNCKISDPGMAINVIRFTLFKKIKANNKILNLTNDSHFPHLFNIIIFENKFLFKEKSIDWGEGNIKSHLTAIPINYVINLLFYLLRYLIFGRFKPIKKNNFKYTIY